MAINTEIQKFELDFQKEKDRFSSTLNNIKNLKANLNSNKLILNKIVKRSITKLNMEL